MYIKKGLPKQDGNGNRLYFARGIYVSKNGKTIYNIQNNSSYPHYYKPHPDKTGRLYITNDGDRLYVDELVAACYLHKPQDGRKYNLIHKDGDIANNFYGNLEWQYVPPTPYVVNMDLDCIVGKVKVKCDGMVYAGKKQLTIYDHLYDSDTDLFVTIRPHIIHDGKRVCMDDLIEKARFVHGDRDKIATPKILHKDHDPMNYNRDNLEWVEDSSKEYQDYLTDYWKWEYDNNIKINPGKRFPDFMQPKL